MNILKNFSNYYIRINLVLVLTICILFYDRFFTNLLLISDPSKFHALVFFTDFSLIALIFAFILYFFAKRQFSNLMLFLLLLFFLTGLDISLKQTLKITGPDLSQFKHYLFMQDQYTFPSIHAFIASFLATFSYFKSKKYFPYILFICLSIGILRVSMGIHYFSDIQVSALLASLITYFSINLDDKLGFFSWFFDTLQNELELRRQLLHLIVGTILIILFISQLLTKEILLVVTLIGIFLSILCRFKNLPLITKVLNIFERDHDINTFPGKGVVFMFLGTTITFYVFPPHIAMASLTILTIGDSLTHMVGKYLGSIKTPLNSHKNIEGFIMGALFSALFAAFFVPFPYALIASFIVMFIELLTVKIGKYKIDDNLYLTIISGFILFTLMA
jgi:dolichol kinase/membrane-associated phospholipid phosphatase